MRLCILCLHASANYDSICVMAPTAPDLPDDLDALTAPFAAAARARRMPTTRRRSPQLKLEIAKLKRQIYGPRSERAARLIEQMELELEEPAAAATEAEIASERASAKTTTVTAFERKRPARQPFPAHLPRERVVVPGATAAVLRWRALAQTRRDHHRDAGSHSAPVESDPARAREDDLPGLRDDQRAAGAVPRHAARLGRPEPPRDAAVREVRPASAAEPASRTLCAAKACR